MFATLIALPIFSLLVIIQTSIVSRVPMLHGTADLTLLVVVAWGLQERVRTAWQWSIIAGLMVGFVTSLGIYIPLISYLAITALALLIRQRIWQIPILAMFVVTMIGTLFHHMLTALTLSITGTPLPWLEAFQVVTLPSLLLNLLLAAPIFAIARDFADWLYPEEIQI